MIKSLIAGYSLVFNLVDSTADPNGPLASWLRDPNAWNHRAWASITHSLAPIVAVAPAVLIVAAVVACTAVAFGRFRDRGVLSNPRIVEVSLPSDVSRRGGEVFWTNLHDLLRPWHRRLLYGQPHISFEFVWRGPSLRIRIWLPRVIPLHIVEGAVSAAWPGASTKLVEQDHVRELEGSAIKAGQFRFAHPEWFPLHSDHDLDPLRALFASLTGLGEGESALVQIVARPASSRRTGRLIKVAGAMRSGKSHSPVLRLLDFVTPNASSPTTSASTSNIRVGEDVRMILAKASELGWELSIRYAVGAKAHDKHTRRQLTERAHGLAGSFALYSGRNRLRRCRLHRPLPVLLSRRLGKGDLASIPELAALAHLPTDQIIPGIERGFARRVAPVERIASRGILIGDADGGPTRPVAIGHQDAPYHVHLMGSTGTGKSTLITNMVLGDFKAGRGAVVIDPKGDLVTDILDRLHPSDAERVILLDPSEMSIAPSLDVLGGDDPQLTVDNIVGIFRNIFASSWGPRTDDILRSACLTLRTRPKASLVDVPLLLSDDEFRREYTHGLTDRVGLGGFWSWYESLPESQRAQVAGPILGKLRLFVWRDFVRKVVTPGTNSLSLEEVLDGKLLLVRIPKGILGSETVKLLGSLVVARVWQAALTRISENPSERLGATLYVDECHNFLNLPGSVEDMLAEARGYGLSMVLAHQHLGQLRSELRTALSANARNKVFFSMSPEDAGSLERHFLPELSAQDLARMGGYRVAARFVVDGKAAPAFTAATRPSASSCSADAARLRSALRKRGEQ